MEANLYIPMLRSEAERYQMNIQKHLDKEIDVENAIDAAWLFLYLEIENNKILSIKEKREKQILLEQAYDTLLSELSETKDSENSTGG